jgi:hypothetical protein
VIGCLERGAVTTVEGVEAMSWTGGGGAARNMDGDCPGGRGAVKLPGAGAALGPRETEAVGSRALPAPRGRLASLDGDG